MNELIKIPFNNLKRHYEIYRDIIDDVVHRVISSGWYLLGEELEDFGSKNPAAVLLGRMGGKKGGRARAEKLSPERRKEIARKAAAARWKNNDS